MVSPEYNAERDKIDAGYFFVVHYSGFGIGLTVSSVETCKADALYRVAERNRDELRLRELDGRDHGLRYDYTAVRKGMHDNYPGSIRTSADAKSYVLGRAEVA